MVEVVAVVGVLEGVDGVEGLLVPIPLSMLGARYTGWFTAVEGTLDVVCDDRFWADVWG